MPCVILVLKTFLLWHECMDISVFSQSSVDRSRYLLNNIHKINFTFSADNGPFTHQLRTSAQTYISCSISRSWFGRQWGCNCAFLKHISASCFCWKRCYPSPSFVGLWVLRFNWARLNVQFVMISFLRSSFCACPHVLYRIHVEIWQNELLPNMS